MGQSATVSAAAAATPVLGLRVDCMHDFNATNGSAQQCLSLSGLSVDLNQESSPTLSAKIRLDPFATPRPSRATSPLRANLPAAGDSAMGIIDQARLTWIARPSLELSLRSYEGATLLPAVSGLAMANQLMDAGWKQLALTLDYNLNALIPTRVVLAAGNGEGQTVRPVTPQQYFGVRAEVTIFEHLQLSLAGAANGNDLGSEEQIYTGRVLKQRCGINVDEGTKGGGHSTRRAAVGVTVSGALVGLEGLRLGAGWQSNLTKDLVADKGGFPSVAQIAEGRCQLDPDLYFVEEEGVQSSVQRTTLNLSFRHNFSSGMYLAGDYSTRRITSQGGSLIRLCDFGADGGCVAGAQGNTSLDQTAWTIGLGTALAPNLDLSLEYFSASFDRHYVNFYYPGADGHADRDFTLFNARLAYRWQS
ncbi:MAG: hypothetical protein FJ146_00235 [Deltaproteobacteria bacterium]|nr:hypothetical protein [Deltaproteobacteria bacterium]